MICSISIQNSNIMNYSKTCKKCEQKVDPSDPNVVSRTRVVTQKSSSSSGCSMSRYWYCSEECAPNSNEQLPPSNSQMIIGEVISIKK